MVVELILLFLMVAGAIFASRIDSKRWLLVDAAITFLFGACTIPFAVQSQEMQTTGIKVDAFHGYLCNLYIGYCLMPAVASVLLRDSTDPTTTTALLLSRTVGPGLATLVIAYGHFFTSIFNSMHLVYGVLGNAVWTAVNAYHLFLGGKANKRGVSTKVDFFLKVDLAIALCYALPDLLLPDLFMGLLLGREPDALHLHLMQVGAGVHLGTAALAYMAFRFSSKEHKKAVLLSRIAIMSLMWMLRTYSWIMLETSTSFFSYFMACLGYLPFFPAYVGIRIKD
ncbi:uncharacterized protein LOC143288489 [Babylonia areolata]|uniref:uncharacterized protein LOC143288489 n=1 Tax=Babylonia areolata TaxID=304850 RepID=UPI003FD503D4